MRITRHLLSFLFCASLLACTSTHQATTPESKVTEVSKSQIDLAPKKHPLDQSETRRFVLDNGIPVLVISDPKFNKSAASLTVTIGSMSDTKERLGMAHYLEHMLFMGTEKYPAVDDYPQYISENGGWRNAYTTSDHTNYHMDIKHDAFEGGLDRLSQFFIAPLFDKTYTDREINAVNSEFQRLLENDGWRTSQVQKLFLAQDHPVSNFVVGSTETLTGVTPEELFSFYQKNYSADRMRLVLLGTAPLDTLQTWATRYFSPIKNRNLGQVHYAEIYQPEKATFRLIHIEPVKDLRTIEIEFPLPSYYKDFSSKPDALLGGLIGHEGAGSLLSLLKEKGYATGLSSGVYLWTTDFGRVSMDLTVTPKGLENYLDVVRLCLAYVNMLKSEPYPSYYYQELAAKARLDEIYTDRGEGYSYASALGRTLSKYPLEIADRIDYLFGEENPAAYKRLLSYLRPDNMVVTLTAKGLSTSKTEHFFGTAYDYTESDSLFAAVQNTPLDPRMHLPAPNPFIPRQASIPNRPFQESVIPAEVLTESGVQLYHSLDTQFLRPKVSLQFKIRLPREALTPRFKVLLDTYTDCVNESLNELAYPASLAGLNFRFQNGYEGVYFSIDGFDESAEKLYATVLEHMKHVTVTEQTFEAIKDRNIRNHKDFSKQEAWRIVRTYAYDMLNAVSYTPAEQLAVLETLTLDDIQSFAATLYQKGFIEGLVHGNLSADQATLLTRKMQHDLEIQATARETTFNQSFLRQNNPEAIWSLSNLEVNNSALRRNYYMGDNSPRNHAISLILAKFIDRPFFTEMRSNQQLGYIVAAGVAPLARTGIYAYFIIQSDGYAADEVNQRADVFIATYGERFDALSSEAFENLRATALEELKQKAKTIAEMAGELNEQAFTFGGDFKRKQKSIEALQTLTQEEVGSLLKTMLNPETRRMQTTLGFAREHKPTLGLKPSFEDLAEWKKTREYK
jgi:insulysin